MSEGQQQRPDQGHRQQPDEGRQRQPDQGQQRQPEAGLHPESFWQHPASYRDPAGFVFRKNGIVYRQVNQSYAGNYRQLMDSGAYQTFTSEGLLVTHTEIAENLTAHADWFLTLQPAQLRIHSYPWEWSFDMLKDSALLTLQLAKKALGFGLSLKDATPMNTQWLDGRLRFIDTLSFEKYNEQQPWVAYRQFCETYLSPLLLMHYSRLPMQEITAAYPDGIPLAITSSLLPFRSRFRIPVYLHIHLHAKVSAGTKPAAGNQQHRFSRTRMINLLDNLDTLVRSLRLAERSTAWLGYYDEAAGREGYLPSKKALVREWISGLAGIKTVTDLGANEGEFSLIAAGEGKEVLCTDMDPFCVNRIYRKIKDQGVSGIQPMVTDLSKPAAAMGFGENEFASFSSRTSADLVMALALVHHLCIGRHLPPARVAGYFASLGNWLLLEYVPADDPKSLLLLGHGQAAPAPIPYTRDTMLAAFSQYFELRKQSPVAGSGRELWLMEKINPGGYGKTF